ncbi:MAG: SDR family oxidoreductase [Spirochaetaceae bacterium]|jgi:all-trans-retinol dehydrogenase (NAD+)|nr:SDR family oxidoreductase [Spirochaetaceae bacterium]
MKKIENSIVLITGGASGIGRLMAFSFAAKGARVICWDINPESISSLELEGAQRGLFIRGMVCDVSDREMVYRLAGTVTADFGPVDILIQNAGVVSGKTFLETPDEKMEKSMDINAVSLFWTTKAFLPSMIERNSGHIVTVSSAAGLIGVTGLADYSASKFASFGFHEAIRMELQRLKKKVKTTIVCPYFINTGMFDGVRTRFPLLLPILESDYAAKRIVDAVLREKKRLIMPRFVYLVYLLRLLPVGIFDAAVSFFGINNTMDNFTGREGKKR